MRILLALLSTAIACGGDDGGGEAELLQDLSFEGYVGGDTAGDPVAIRLSDYTAEKRPGTKILMLNAAAGWCVPCMREAEAMGEFAAAYEPEGVAIVVAVFQDQNAEPASPEFVTAWIDNFDLDVPVVIDGDFQTSLYFDVNVMPANLFVDAETLEILTVAEGAETGDDPMSEYRELLDHYLSE